MKIQNADNWLGNILYFTNIWLFPKKKKSYIWFSFSNYRVTHMLIFIRRTQSNMLSQNIKTFTKIYIPNTRRHISCPNSQDTEQVNDHSVRNENDKI